MLADIINRTRRARFDRAGDYTLMPTLGKNALFRDAQITIRKVQNEDGSELFTIQLNGQAFGLTQKDDAMLAELNINRHQLHELIEVCRRAWRTAIMASDEREHVPWWWPPWRWWKTKERPLKGDLAFVSLFRGRISVPTLKITLDR